MAIPLALLAAIPSLVKAGAGVAQTIKANKLAKTPRPTMEVPDAEKEALATARMMAYDSGMQGQNLLENKLQGSTASGVRAIRETGRDSSEIINSIIGMYGNEQNSLNDIAISGANSQNQRMNQLMGQLGRVGNYQQQQFNYNQAAPYQEDMDASSALRGAGAQNLFGALNDATNIGLYMAMNKDIFGQGGGQGGVEGGADGSGGGINMGTLGGQRDPGINMGAQNQRQMGLQVPGMMPQVPQVQNNQMPYSPVVAGGGQNFNQQDFMSWVMSMNPQFKQRGIGMQVPSYQ